MLLVIDGKQERILSALLAGHALELADRDVSETTDADLEDLAATENLILQIATQWGVRNRKG